jgi:hypothetical protein
MSNCQSCGNHVLDEYQFCGHCGRQVDTSLAVTQTSEKTSLRSGTILRDQLHAITDKNPPPPKNRDKIFLLIIAILTVALAVSLLKNVFTPTQDNLVPHNPQSTPTSIPTSTPASTPTSTPTPTPTALATPTRIAWGCSNQGFFARMNGGATLPPGGCAIASNWNTVLIMQLDGNLVIYDFYAKPLWGSNTMGGNKDRFAAMQQDGNFCIYPNYPEMHNALWCSNTSGHSGAFLAVQDNGNIVVYDAEGVRSLWETGTKH